MCHEAVCQEGSALLYLDQEIKERDEIVLAAVTNRGNALSMASPEQKKNREIVFAAVYKLKKEEEEKWLQSRRQTTSYIVLWPGNGSQGVLPVRAGKKGA